MGRVIDREKLFCDRLRFSRTPTKTELRIIRSAKDVGILTRIRMTHGIQDRSGRRSGAPALRSFGAIHIPISGDEISAV